MNADAPARVSGGQLQLGRFGTVDVDLENIDWSMNPLGHDSFEFQLHSLVWALPLVFGAASNTSYVADARVVLRSWVDNNPEERPPSERSWGRHSTALRAQVLSCAASLFKSEAWYRRALAEHRDWLADSEHFDGAWNHGIDQALGLLTASCTIGDPEGTSIATTRISEIASQSVSRRGVSNEQAVGYHAYVQALYMRMIENLEACGIDPPAPLARADRMYEFMWHARRPDGRWAQLGDTHQSAVGEVGGIRPDQTGIVYEDAGYAFARDRWQLPQWWYSIRFGPHRQIHGHRDHTSVEWFVDGAPILVEAGFSGYGDDDGWRMFERSHAAHNVLDFRDAGRFLWQEPTELVEHEIAGTWQSFTMLGRPYQAVQHRRRQLLFAERVLVVNDTWSAGRDVTAEQLWHFPPGWQIDVGTDAVIASDGHASVHVFHRGAAEISVVEGVGGAERQGWIAVGRNNRSPAPVLALTSAGDRPRLTTVFVVARAREDEPVVKWLEDESAVMVGDRNIVFDTPLLRVATPLP